VGYAFVFTPYFSGQHLRYDYSHPAEPQCSYDPVEGLPLAPDTDPLEKIKQLENEICAAPYYILPKNTDLLTIFKPAHLKSRLYDQQGLPGSVSPNRPHSNTSNASLRDPLTHSPSAQPDVASISLPHAALSMPNVADAHTVSLRDQYGNSESHALNSSPGPGLDNFMDLLFLGWNPDLPDPATLNH
jgi:hypothetical protein